MKYRKKPVVIEALGPLDESNAADIAAWCGGRMVTNVKPSDPTDVYVALEIPTLEGVMRAEPHDYVIKGIQGEFYPCKPSIFAATYDEVSA